MGYLAELFNKSTTVWLSDESSLTKIFEIKLQSVKDSMAYFKVHVWDDEQLAIELHHINRCIVETNGRLGRVYLEKRKREIEDWFKNADAAALNVLVRNIGEFGEASTEFLGKLGDPSGYDTSSIIPAHFFSILSQETQATLARLAEQWILSRTSV